MKNLILNSQWLPGPNAMPLYFSGTGVTYDDFCINGFRTCSITLSEDNSTGNTVYEPEINVYGRQAIDWGFEIRAIEAGHIVLVADFYDAFGELVESSRYNLSEYVTDCFSRQFGHFQIPHGAQTVHLSIAFSEKVTACTYFSPAAYFTCL